MANKNKYSVYDSVYGWVKYLREAQEQEAQDPNQQMQQGAPQPPVPPPQGNPAPDATPDEQTQGAKAKQPAQTQPFRTLAGKTIKNVAFSPSGNGGTITIKTDAPVPSKISWIGTKVTFTDDKGNVVTLSS